MVHALTGLVILDRTLQELFAMTEEYQKLISNKYMMNQPQETHVNSFFGCTHWWVIIPSRSVVCILSKLFPINGKKKRPDTVWITDFHCYFCYYWFYLFWYPHLEININNSIRRGIITHGCSQICRSTYLFTDIK